MSEATRTPENRHANGSVAALLAGIVHDAQRLISQQIELVKVEIKEDLRKTINGAIVIAAGNRSGCWSASCSSVSMAVYLLDWAFLTLGLWLCFLIVGGLLTLLGATLVYAAVRRFSTFNPLPGTIPSRG